MIGPDIHLPLLVVAFASWSVSCTRFGFEADASATLDVGVSRDAARDGRADAASTEAGHDTSADLSDGSGPTADARDLGGTMDLGRGDLPTATFSGPVALNALNTAGHEDGPSLTADQLEIYFERDGDVFRATRNAKTDPWGPPARVAELSSVDDDSGPRVLPDGLTLYLTSTRPSTGPGAADIFVARRASRAAPWGAPTVVADLSSSAGEYAGVTTSDELLAVFSSDRPGTLGPTAIWWSSRPSVADPWTTPTMIPGINSSNYDTTPWISADGLVLSFASSRAGTLGQHDLWISARVDRQAPFSVPTQVPGVNSSGFEMEPWLSDDLKVIYFSQGYPTGDLYMATR